MPVKIVQISSSTIVRAARDAGSHQHLASVLQQGRKSANIRVSLGVIRGIPGYRRNLGKLITLGETVNTSLIRECLELILMLADALERKKAGPPITVSQNSLPVTPQVAPVELLGSVRHQRPSGVLSFGSASRFRVTWTSHAVSARSRPGGKSYG
jgi:hypothetical protein